MTEYFSSPVEYVFWEFCPSEAPHFPGKGRGLPGVEGIGFVISNNFHLTLYREVPNEKRIDDVRSGRIQNVDQITFAELSNYIYDTEEISKRLLTEKEIEIIKYLKERRELFEKKYLPTINLIKQLEKILYYPLYYLGTIFEILSPDTYYFQLDKTIAPLEKKAKRIFANAAIKFEPFIKAASDLYAVEKEEEKFIQEYHYPYKEEIDFRDSRELWPMTEKQLYNFFSQSKDLKTYLQSLKKYILRKLKFGVVFTVYNTVFCDRNYPEEPYDYKKVQRELFRRIARHRYSNDEVMDFYELLEKEAAKNGRSIVL